MEGPSLLDRALEEIEPRRRRRLHAWWLLLVAAALVAGLAVLAVDVGHGLSSAAKSVQGGLGLGLGLDPVRLDPHAAQYRAYAHQKLTATAEQSPPPTSPSNLSSGPAQAGAQQFDCLDNLWENESGWSPTARNPDSTAYGIAQFLDQTWTLMGVAKTSEPYEQIDSGLAYIAKRYGTPCDAWTFWQQNHWY